MSLASRRRSRRLKARSLEGLDSLSPETLRYIGQFLVQALDGSPAQIVSVARDEGHNVMEQWRLLAQFCDPASDARNSADRKYLHSPRTGEKLSPSTRMETIMSMMPVAMEEELRQKEGLTLETLERYIITVARRRAESAAPKTAQSVEFSPTANDGEDNDIFMLVRGVDGKQSFVRKGNGKGYGKDRGPVDMSKKECFRCGHLGHFGRDCTAKAHKNGGPCIPAPPPKAPGKGRGKTAASSLEAAD